MDNTAKNQPLPPDLVQRRQQLADALGFLLAQAWLRDHRPSAVQATEDPQRNDQPEHPP